jgi:hypothetical protein
MFIVRSTPFSSVFLLACVVIAIQLSVVVKGLVVGSYKFTRANDPLFFILAFTMVTIVCFAGYVVTALIRLIISHFSSEK